MLVQGQPLDSKHSTYLKYTPSLYSPSLTISNTLHGKNFLPSPRRSTYVFRLDTWLYGMLRPNVWNESIKRFVMRCLEDLRNWHTDETGYKVIEEDDEMGQFFEEWPARIQAFEERMQQGKNTV